MQTFMQYKTAQLAKLALIVIFPRNGESPLSRRAQFRDELAPNLLHFRRRELLQAQILRNVQNGVFFSVGALRIHRSFRGGAELESDRTGVVELVDEAALR